MTLYILRRSNGCYGIYKNGKSPENLISNSFLTDSANHLINRILLDVAGNAEPPQVIFTDNELDFQSDFPKIQSVLINIETQE